MKAKVLIITLLALSVVIAASFLFGRKTSAPETSPEEEMEISGFRQVPPENQAAPPENTVSIEMDSGNFFFTPANLTVKKGDLVKIEFTNMGRHTFVIDELSIKKTVVAEKETLEFVAEKAGTFKFYCDIPGHQARGMEGTINIEE
ncbi:MAG: Blue (Type 1) copper domain protein [Candidatus Moranbacteria bacterium GW2011_GWE1_49_15]|nr:MAG: Blue (Type 1) copper domain protein [Candidatus Moranbacteria bacterium GW2011_GWE1_49_15]HBP01553.1 hypothetical protein [Candidatus Moranbacteria bacterium]